jgi:hypothetical protein
MPLLANEIQPGAVAILDGNTLQNDAAVHSPDHQGTVRSGPFVCVQVKDGQCTWLHLTGQKKGNLRLELKPEWKVDGSPLWQAKDQFINDARKPFFGPIASFANAGSNELPHQPHKRPMVSSAGVAAIIAEVQKYGIQLL